MPEHASARAVRAECAVQMGPRFRARCLEVVGLKACRISFPHYFDTFRADGAVHIPPPSSTVTKRWQAGQAGAQATGRSTWSMWSFKALPGGRLGLAHRSVWTSREVPSGSMVVDFKLTSSEALQRQQKEIKGHVFAPLRTEERTASIEKVWEPFWVFDAQCQSDLHLNLNLNLNLDLNLSSKEGNT